MGKWIRGVSSLISSLGSLISMSQAIRWAVADQGVVKIADMEFDERMLVDAYVWGAFLGLSVALLLVTPFAVPLFENRLRFKSYRFGDMLSELRQTRDSLRHFFTDRTYEGESYERLRQTQRNLEALGITGAVLDETRLEMWEEYLDRLCVLAEQRRYREARALWYEMV